MSQAVQERKSDQDCSMLIRLTTRRSFNPFSYQVARAPGTKTKNGSL